MKMKISLMITVAVLLLGLCVLGGSVGCKSFDPVQVKGEVSECNDFYTVLKYNVKAENRDGAFAAVVYEQCKQARAQKRQIEKERHCAGLYFTNGVVDKTDYKQYSQFLECCK